MTIKRKIYGGLVLSLALMNVAAYAQQPEAEKPPTYTSVRFDTIGAVVEFTTEMQPGGEQPATVNASTHLRGDANTTHRVFVNRSNGAMFGYDLQVEPLVATNQFKLTVKPLSLAPSAAKPARPGAIPKYPGSIVVTDGATLELDVLFNSQTGVKIVDLIRVSSRAQYQIDNPPARQLAPRDFTPQAVELSVKNFKLTINGEAVIGNDGRGRGSVSGAVIWIYLHERGRFIFSLLPQDSYGFQKIGVVNHNKISFQLGADRYEWISVAPILSSVGAGTQWHVWVKHEPDYVPEDTFGSNSPYVFGAADDITNVLKEN